MRRLLGSLIVAGSALGMTAALPAAPVQAATVPAGFTDASVASFSGPTAVEWLPSDQVVVLERGGRLKIGPPDGPFVTAYTVPDICTDGEEGLLGLATDPDFLGNGWVYVYTTRTAAGAPGGCVNRVSRLTLVGNQVVAGSELVLLDNISARNGNHNGGDLDFGSDGYLYVAIGDAGGDPRNDSSGINDAAQDLSLLNGKILRITRDGQPAPGNPISGGNSVPCATRGNTPSTPTTPCQEIFAYGLRNPYRFAFDRNDGSSTFFINDVGQSTYEEVNLGQRGANYGWPIREGACPQGDEAPCDGPAPGSGLVDPITSYGRTEGQYVTAGAFVPNGLWPAEYDGGYLFGDGGSGRIWLRRANGTVDYATPFATGAQGLTDMTFGFDAAGKMVLYYVQFGGSLRRVTPSAAPAPTPSSAMAYQAITPDRAYDTETNLAGVAPGNVVNGTTRLVDLAAPAGARAALVNVTIAGTAGPGFLRTWIAGGARPETSTVNAERGGAFVANAAVVPLDAQGRFIVEATTTARVVVDVMGWFTPSGATTAGRFVAVDPVRITETRESSGPGNDYTRVGNTITVYPWGQGGAPSGEPASAVVLSIGAIAGSGFGGFVGAYPAGGTYGGTSNVNFLNGDVRANTVVVPLGTGNGVSLATLDVAHVVVEVVGYFTSSGAGSGSTGLFSFVTPDRLVDTRQNLGFGRLGALSRATLNTGVAGSAVLQNVTVTNTSAAGWLATYPAGAATPTISTVNFVDSGQTRAVLAFTKQNAGQVSYESLVPTDAVVDVIGSFS